MVGTAVHLRSTQSIYTAVAGKQRCGTTIELWRPDTAGQWLTAIVRLAVDAARDATI
jgi:hypothetical protein